MGEYLFFHAGNVHYIEDGTNNDSVDSTTIIIIVLALTVVVLIVLFLSIILIWKSCSKSKPTNTMPYATMDTDINMYASPAYGTHQVFTEPELDHLYERIDDIFMDEAIQNADNNNNWMLKLTNIHNETDDHAVLQNDDKKSESSTGYVIKRTWELAIIWI